MAMNRQSESMRTFGTVVAIALVYSFCYRIVPGWVIPNLAPIGALAFYCGYAGNRWAFALIPLCLMGLSDTVLHFTLGYPAVPSVYVSMVVYTLLGLVGAKLSWGSRAGLLLGGSVFFFVVTNFGNWLMSRVPFEQLGGTSYAVVPSAIYPFEIKYANDIWGLLANYGMALGFLGRTLAADLGFSAVLVALTLAFSALPHGVPVLVRSKNQS